MNEDDCLPRHCIKDPVAAPCRKYCIKILTESATVVEKVLILGFRYSTAQAIFSAYNSGRDIRTYEDLIERLTDAQIREIEERFDNTTPAQRAYFQIERRYRETIIQSLGRLPWSERDY